MRKASAFLAAALAAAGMSCRTPGTATTPAPGGKEAPAPQAGTGTESPRGPAPADPRALLLGRLLKLDDGQAEKVAEIYRSDAEAQRRRKEDRRAKIREILDAGQRKKFDDLLRSLDPTPEERQATFVQGVLGLLRRGLDLTEEQEGRIRPVLEKACGELVERMRRLRGEGGGGADRPREFRKTVLQVAELGARIRRELDKAQREKFDRFVKGHLGWILRHLPRPPGRK